MAKADRTVTTGENMRVIGGMIIAAALFAVLWTDNMLVVIMAVMGFFGGAYIIIQGQKLILSVEDRSS